MSHSHGSAPTPKKNPGSAPAHVDEISEFESERTVSKVRKKKRRFLSCAALLCKVNA